MKRNSIIRRTNFPVKQFQVNQDILGSIAGRIAMSNLMSTQSFGGSRDMFNALGYKKDVNFYDYLSRYIRQDIAKAIIDRPITATWQGDLRVLESKEIEDTKFEKQFKDLVEDFKLRSIFIRLDKLICLGQYGVLLLGTSDLKELQDYARPIGKSELKYLKPLSEASARIYTYNINPSSPRFGLPELYQVTIESLGNGRVTTVPVHHSRLLHITYETLESEVYGIPRLEAVFNRLFDIEKVAGGSAEMFWRGARPGYAGTVDKEMNLSTQMKEDLTDQIEEYEQNLRRFLINKGVDIKSLEQQVADPTKQLDAQITLISAVTNIPKRILMGSERGELSSSQDVAEWTAYVEARRLSFAEGAILRPFIKKCSELGILTVPETYDIAWSDLYSKSEKEKAEIGKTRAEALASYANSIAASAFIPNEAFYELFLGFSDEQKDLVLKYLEQSSEAPLTGAERALLQQEQNELRGKEGRTLAANNPLKQGGVSNV